MSKETTIAYPRLRREWSGKVMRYSSNAVRGLPDFILIHDHRVLFAEVKWRDETYWPELTKKQALELLELQRHGALCCVLVCLSAGWLCYSSGFMEMATRRSVSTTGGGVLSWAGRRLDPVAMIDGIRERRDMGSGSEVALVNGLQT